MMVMMNDMVPYGVSGELRPSSVSFPLSLVNRLDTSSPTFSGVTEELLDTMEEYRK